MMFQDRTLQKWAEFFIAGSTWSARSYWECGCPIILRGCLDHIGIRRVFQCFHPHWWNDYRIRVNQKLTRSWSKKQSADRSGPIPRNGSISHPEVRSLLWPQIPGTNVGDYSQLASADKILTSAWTILIPAIAGPSCIGFQRGWHRHLLNLDRISSLQLCAPKAGESYLHSLFGNPNQSKLEVFSFVATKHDHFLHVAISFYLRRISFHCFLEGTFSYSSPNKRYLPIIETPTLLT